MDSFLLVNLSQIKDQIKNSKGKVIKQRPQLIYQKIGLETPLAEKIQQTITNKAREIIIKL